MPSSDDLILFFKFVKKWNIFRLVYLYIHFLYNVKVARIINKLAKYQVIGMQRIFIELFLQLIFYWEDGEFFTNSRLEIVRLVSWWFFIQYWRVISFKDCMEKSPTRRRRTYVRVIYNNFTVRSFFYLWDHDDEGKDDNGHEGSNTHRFPTDWDEILYGQSEFFAYNYIRKHRQLCSIQQR